MKSRARNVWKEGNVWNDVESKARDVWNEGLAGAWLRKSAGRGMQG